MVKYQYLSRCYDYKDNKVYAKHLITFSKDKCFLMSSEFLKREMIEVYEDYYFKLLNIQIERSFIEITAKMWHEARKLLKNELINGLCSDVQSIISTFI
jgi:hypothetical protein